MPEDTADIVGSINSEFTITLSPDEVGGTTGVIKKATLKVDGKPDADLPFSAHEITIKDPNKLPPGDSIVVLNILWGPGNSDAIIDVRLVTSGNATAVVPRHFIQVDDVPGFVQLFGK